MNAHYQVLKEVALSLQIEYKIAIIFYFYSPLFDLTKEINDAKNCGFHTVVCNEFNESSMSLTTHKPLNSIANNKKVSIFKKIKENKRKLMEFNNTLSTIKPSLILISDNSINYDITLFIKSCKMNNTKIFCIPFGMINSECVLERIEKSDIKKSYSFIDKITSKVFPKYVLKKNGIGYLPVSSSSIFALQYMKVNIKRPWAWNAHDITGVFVDSISSKELNLNQGLLLDNMIFTQPIEKCDTKSYLSREQFIQRLSLDPNLPILLFNIPAPLSGLLGLKGCSFDNPKSIVNAFLDLPKQIVDNTNLVWTLHPRLKKEDFIYVESKGVKILEISGAKLIPICDIFIGSDSTLFKTALLMSKPVVNFQVFGLNTEIFSNEKGYFVTKNKYQYQKIINILINNKRFYDKVVNDIENTRFGNDKSYPLVHEYLFKFVNQNKL